MDRSEMTWGEKARSSAEDRRAHESRWLSVLEEAASLVSGARNSDYGPPLDNHTTTAALVTAYLHRKYGHVPVTLIALDAEDVCVFNILQKVSREAHKPGRDNAVDIAGYAANLQLVRDERDRRAA